METKKLYRSRTDRKIFGLCGGIGDYLNLDPTVVRIFFIIAAASSAVIPMLLIYFVISLIIPEAELPTGRGPAAAQPQPMTSEVTAEKTDGGASAPSGNPTQLGKDS